MSDENRKKTWKTALAIDGQTFTVFMWHNKSCWIMRCDSDTPGDASDVAWEKFYAALNSGNWHAWKTLRGAREQMRLAAAAVGAAAPLWAIDGLQEAGTKKSCSDFPETEYVLCRILIEGGAGLTEERRNKTIAHLQKCALCDEEGNAIVDRLRSAVGQRPPT